MSAAMAGQGCIAVGQAFEQSLLLGVVVRANSCFHPIL